MKFTLKNLLTLLAGVAVIVLVTVLLSQCMLTRPRAFELEEQQAFLDSYARSNLPERFPVLNEPVGTVDSAKQARQIAESLWTALYGEAAAEQEPYEVYYDADNQVWCVSGTVSYFQESETDGVLMLILSRETGEILAIGRN